MKIIKHSENKRSNEYEEYLTNHINGVKRSWNEILLPALLKEYDMTVEDVLTGDTYVSIYGNSKLLNRIINIHEHTDIIDNFKICAWSKLFSWRFLQENNIKFNNYPYAEDWEFSIQGITKAKSIYFFTIVIFSLSFITPPFCWKYPLKPASLVSIEELL